MPPNDSISTTVKRARERGSEVSRITSCLRVGAAVNACGFVQERSVPDVRSCVGALVDQRHAVGPAAQAVEERALHPSPAFSTTVRGGFANGAHSASSSSECAWGCKNHVHQRSCSGFLAMSPEYPGVCLEPEAECALEGRCVTERLRGSRDPLRGALGGRSCSARGCSPD